MISYGKATRKDLRSTGLVVGTAFVVLGLLVMIRHGHGKVPAPVLLGLGGVLLALGFLAPALLRPFHFVWMLLAEAMGFVMNRVILGLIFFVFFAPAGLVMRLIGKDPLHRGFKKRRQSYWVVKTDAVVPPERYERQF